MVESFASFEFAMGFFLPGKAQSHLFLSIFDTYANMAATKNPASAMRQDFLYVHLQKSEGPMAWRFPAGPAMYFAPLVFGNIWQRVMASLVLVELVR